MIGENPFSEVDDVLEWDQEIEEIFYDRDCERSRS